MRLYTDAFLTLNPFHYAVGRWLRGDKEQRAARYFRLG